MKTEILYGINPVFEALKADRRKFFEIYIGENKASGRIAKVVKFAESKKIPVKKVKKIFVEVEQYKGIVNALGSIRANIIEAGDALTRMEGTNNSGELQLERWQSALDTIQNHYHNL